MDRALQTRRRGIWAVTIAILVVGLIVLVWSFSPTERHRRDVMGRLEIGDDSARVAQLVGSPLRCPGSAMDALRRSLPTDWPPAAAEQALRRLEADTGERWLYPIHLRQRIGCTSQSPHTEVGIDRRGRVLWYVPVTGKSTIVLPDQYSPSGEDS